jgi:hypothetical protein
MQSTKLATREPSLSARNPKNPGRLLISLTVLTISLSLFISILFAPTPLSAQVGTADVLGTVSDQTGAVVPNATVTIKNVGTSAARTATTNDKGEYIFNTLPNGTYNLSVEVKGFKSYLEKGFTLSTGDRARHDAKLQTGEVTETVQVTASQTAEMQTDSSEVTSTIQSNTVQDLPLNERNIQSAVQVQPGISMGAGGSLASGTAPEDRRPSFVVVANGQNDNLNNQLIDGFDNNERNLGLSGVRPSIDGIQEVKVDTSSYSAEYGRAAGAIINIITKSGSNDFHGSLYEYFRNDIFDSYSFFDVSKAKYRLNSYGGSVGGPVWIPKIYKGKNKTFFFVDFEQDRKVAGLSGNLLTVPTAYEHTQMDSLGVLDLTDLDSSLAIVPAVDIDPIMKNYFSLFPTPNYTGTGGNYSNTPALRQNGTNVDVRIDHHIGANDVLFGRFGYNPVTTTYPETIPQITSGTFAGIYPGSYGATGFPGPSKTKSYNVQADYVHIFSSKLLMDLKTGYTRVNISSEPFNYKTGAAQTMGFAADIDTGDEMPAMGGPGLGWNVVMGSGNQVPLVDINNTFQYVGSVNYTLGSHNLKAGGGVIRRQINAYQNTMGGGYFLFFASADGGGPSWSTTPWPSAKQNFITGNPSMEIRENAVYKPGFRAWEINGYLQDDWRATSKLTINMGIRYDIFTPFTEAHGRYANFDMSCLTSGTVGSNCFVTGAQNATLKVKTDHTDIAPRIGFSYSANPRTVLRGAFGMSFFPPDVGEATSGTGAPVSVLQNYNPPYVFNYNAQMPFGSSCTKSYATGGTSGCIDNGPVQPAVVDLSTFTSNSNITSVSAKPFSLRSSYVEMTNLALQRQFGANNTLTIAYVGEFGRGLLRTINLDQPLPPGAGNAEPGYVYATQMPNVTTINYYYNGSMSAYHSMQVVYAHSLSKGFSVNGNYTWSHNMTDIPINGSLYAGSSHLDYGNSSSDLRHRFAVTGAYEVPFGKNLRGVQGALIKDWKFNVIGYWQSGTAFTVISASNLNVPSLSWDRPNVVTSTKVSNPSISKWFNTSAFEAQTKGTIGNERVNQLFGPHQRDFDFSLNKDFRVFESLKAQFRAECFNVSNTPNFATPDNNSADSTFGEVTAVTTGSSPRQFQFALKLLF